jgi:hypothetical protein
VAKTKNPSWKETGLDASHNVHVSCEGRGRVFSLDILSLQELLQA